MYMLSSIRTAGKNAVLNYNTSDSGLAVASISRLCYGWTLSSLSATCLVSSLESVLAYYLCHLCHLQIFIYVVYLYLEIRVNEAGLGLFGGTKFHFIFSLKLYSTVAFLLFVARVGYVLVNPFTQ